MRFSVRFSPVDAGALDKVGQVSLAAGAGLDHSSDPHRSAGLALYHIPQSLYHTIFHNNLRQSTRAGVTAGARAHKPRSAVQTNC